MLRFKGKFLARRHLEGASGPLNVLVGWLGWLWSTFRSFWYQSISFTMRDWKSRVAIDGHHSGVIKEVSEYRRRHESWTFLLREIKVLANRCHASRELARTKHQATTTTTMTMTTSGNASADRSYHDDHVGFLFRSRRGRLVICHRSAIAAAMAAVDASLNAWDRSLGVWKLKVTLLQLFAHCPIASFNVAPAGTSDARSQVGPARWRRYVNDLWWKTLRRRLSNPSGLCVENYYTSPAARVQRDARVQSGTAVGASAACSFSPALSAIPSCQDKTSHFWSPFKQFFSTSGVSPIDSHVTSDWSWRSTFLCRGRACPSRANQLNLCRWGTMNWMKKGPYRPVRTTDLHGSGLTLRGAENRSRAHSLPL